MNFSITINGDAPELADALKVLKTTLEGHVLNSGAVTTTVTPAAPVPTYPQQEQPVQQPFQGNPVQQPQQAQQAQQGYPQQAQQQQGFPAQQQSAYPQQQGYGQPVPTQQGYQQQQQPVQQTAVPVGTQSYTQDQIAVAATALIESGQYDQVMELMQQFGGPPLTAINKEHYGALATALRGLGAKI